MHKRNRRWYEVWRDPGPHPVLPAELLLKSFIIWTKASSGQFNDTDADTAAQGSLESYILAAE